MLNATDDGDNRLILARQDLMARLWPLWLRGPIGSCTKRHSNELRLSCMDCVAITHSMAAAEPCSQQLRGADWRSDESRQAGLDFV